MRDDLIAGLHSAIADLDRITERCNAGRTIACPDCGGELEVDAPPATIPDRRESPVTVECLDCGWSKQKEAL